MTQFRSNVNLSSRKIALALLRSKSSKIALHVLDEILTAVKLDGVYATVARRDTFVVQL